MSKTSKTTSEKADSESLDASIRGGQIPCVLVYSDRKHVSYVNNIINCIEETIPMLGFKVNKLCDKTPPNAHFGKNFEKLAEECPLGIIVLDGFRPNVLFEYGFLRGRGRVILPIQDKKSYIAIKSLYSLKDHSDEEEIKVKTGLTQKQFNRLKEPPIGHFGQLSDRHGINVVVIDCDAELTSPEHPKRKIQLEVNKLKPQILSDYAERSLKPIEQKSPKYLERFQEVTLKILQYYMNTIPFTSSNIEGTLKQIRELEKESGITLPSAIYETVDSLYNSLAKQAFPSNISEAIRLYRKAIKLNERILEIETDSSRCANAKFRVGNIYNDLLEVRDQEVNLNKAIKAYKEALTIYTKKDSPIFHAQVKKNLELALEHARAVKDLTEEEQKRHLEAS